MFFYFDLGRVLVDFSIENMLARVAGAAGITPEDAREALFGAGLQLEYERGRLTTEEFYEEFCREAGVRPDPGVLCHAAADIFTLRRCMLPLVTQLHEAGYRTGILSNTSDLHWEHCYRRYSVLRESFDVYALSYRIGHWKPEPEIYTAAAALAGVSPQEVFFVDDHPANVDGARAAGFDAVPYTTTAQLAADLRSRAARFNY